VEDPEYLDYVASADEVSDAIVAVEENPNFTLRLGPMCVAHTRKPLQHLGFFIDGSDDTQRGLRVVLCDIAVDILKPNDCFFGPS